MEMEIEEMKNLIRELRNRTGAGLWNCKKALLHSNTFEEAVQYVREHREHRKLS